MTRPTFLNATTLTSFAAGSAALFGFSAHAATITTVGALNTNGRTLVDPTGNSQGLAAYQATITNAFSSNTGGVWDFEDVSNGSFGNDPCIEQVWDFAIKRDEQTP
ncbi:MAG: hypothetical protein AAGI37_05470 [Planctomycetota bacterium]